MSSPSRRPAERDRAHRRPYHLWAMLPLCVGLAMVVGLGAVAAPAGAQAGEEEDGSGGPVSGLMGLLPSEDTSGAPQESAGVSPTPAAETASGTPASDPSVPDSPEPGATTPAATPPSTAPARPIRPSSPPVPPSRSSPPPSTQPRPSSHGESETSGAQPGPGRQWTLTAGKLSLIGSRYHGYSMQEVNGKQVATLHFTAQRLEITDLVQRGALGNGAIMRAASAPGRVSTVTDGPVHLYTRELSGTLSVADYPLVPVTLSPGSLAPPNLDLGFLQLPKLTFTDVTVHNVELSGGTLFIPDARIAVVGQ